MKKLLLLVAALLVSATHAQSPVIDQYVLEDFWLAQQNPRSFIKAIDKTATSWGSKQLYETVTTPTRDMTELSRRQDIVKRFTQSTDSLKNISRTLQHIKPNVPVVEYYSREKVSSESDGQRLAKTCLFRNKSLSSLNSSPTALNLGIALQYLNLGLPLWEHAFWHWVLWLAGQGGSCCGHNHHHHVHDEHHCHDHHHHRSTLQSITRSVLKHEKAIAVIHWGLHVPALYTMAQTMHDTGQDIGAVAKEIRKIASVVSACMKLQEQLKELGHNHVPEFAPILSLQRSSYNGLVGILLDLHNDQSTIPTTWGKILATSTMLQRHTNELCQLMACIGYIDMYCTLATMLTDNQAHWCFAQYLQQDTPFVTFDDLYHPQLLTGHTRLCCNGHRLVLGQAGARHALITGANAAGKSTFMASIVIASILAQSIAIVPAKQWVMTPFAKILSCMRVTDDITHDLSLFAAEMARANHILETIQTSNAAEFVLVGIDESLFKSTQLTSATQLAGKFLKTLAYTNNVISMTITHNLALADVARQYATLFTQLVAKKEVAQDGSPKFVVTDGLFDTAQDPLQYLAKS